MEPINVFDYETLAQACIEPSSWDYYQSGSDDEVTLRANRAAFERIRLRPRMLVDVRTCHMHTTVLGTPVSMPILIAPSAFHCLAHPLGECATAQAAARGRGYAVARPDRLGGARRAELLRRMARREGDDTGGGRSRQDRVPDEDSVWQHLASNKSEPFEAVFGFHQRQISQVKILLR